MQIDRPITIAILIMGIIAFMFFLTVPEYNNYQDLQVQLAEKTAEYNAQVDYYAAIKKTHNDLIARQEEIKKIDEALPQDPAINKVVYYLQDEIKKNGMIMKNLFLSKTSSGTGNIKEIVFSTNLVGDYASLERFIIALEKSSRIFDVTSITFSTGTTTTATRANPASSASSQGFSLQIKTYSYY